MERTRIMKTNHLLAPACVCCAIAGLAFAQPGAPVPAEQPAHTFRADEQLRLSPALGARTAVRITSTEETVQVTGEGLTIRHTGTGTIQRDLVFDVSEVNEAGYTLLASVIDAGVAEAREELPGPVSPEAEQERMQAEQLDRAYSALINKQAVLTVRTDGIITQTLGTNSDAPLWPIIVQFARGAWPYALPEDPLQRTWTFSLEQPLANGFMQTTETTFTLARSSDDTFELDMQQTSVSPKQALPNGALEGGLAGTLQNTGNASGTLTVHRKTGVVTHADITSSSTTLFTIESAEGGKPDTVEQTTSVRVTAEPIEAG